MNIAIITAGGIGSRMGLSVPKQFFEIDGKPLIVFTLEQFQNCDDIDAICVVYLQGYLDVFEQYKAIYGLNKIKWFAEGGETNQLSIYNGLKCLRESGLVSDNDIVMVHDGIRPLVADDIIKDNISICRSKGNAVAVTASNEAMLFSEDGLTSKISINRSKVWKTQTPHSMKFGDMLALVEKTLSKGVNNSVAICTMLIENGIVVNFSKGDNLNFKLTTREDIDLFQGIQKSKNK